MEEVAEDEVEIEERSVSQSRPLAPPPMLVVVLMSRPLAPPPRIGIIYLWSLQFLICKRDDMVKCEWKCMII